MSKFKTEDVGRMWRNLNVLSLFDGISCGRIALERAGIKVNNYYSSEIDKYAIKISKANYPDIVQLGDVTKWCEWDIDWAGIDLLIGGSPCQGFSFAGKQLAFNDPRSKLFFVYVDILNHIRRVKPGVKFMLENVKMKKEYLDVISEQLGVEPVFINSALVSAQNRQRYYWANWEFEQPVDKGIVLADILEDGVVDRDKSYCIDACYYRGGNPEQYFNKSRRQLVFIIQRGRGFNKGGVKAKDGKTPCMSANSWQDNNHLVFKTAELLAGRTLADSGQVATASEIKGYDLMKRVYGLGGKSPTLNACTGGNREPKIATAADGESVMYRKLTPIECERLQTLPDNYTNHVSNTRRYKAIGNGWTVDVIAHILREGFKKL